MGPYMAEGFLRKGTRRISSWPGETTLHEKAGYIDADFLPLNTFPLQSDGGPYIAVTTHHTLDIHPHNRRYLNFTSITRISG